jgi:hypothetical protein
MKYSSLIQIKRGSMKTPPKLAYDEFLKRDLIPYNERSCLKTYKSKISAHLNLFLKSYKNNTGDVSSQNIEFSFWRYFVIFSAIPQWIFHCNISKDREFFSLSNCIWRYFPHNSSDHKFSINGAKNRAE